jgi:hypothetical protein
MHRIVTGMGAKRHAFRRSASLHVPVPGIAIHGVIQGKPKP